MSDMNFMNDLLKAITFLLENDKLVLWKTQWLTQTTDGSWQHVDSNKFTSK